jgi:hypothetical protein
MIRKFDDVFRSSPSAHASLDAAGHSGSRLMLLKKQNARSKKLGARLQETRRAGGGGAPGREGRERISR